MLQFVPVSEHTLHITLNGVLIGPAGDGGVSEGIWVLQEDIKRVYFLLFTIACDLRLWRKAAFQDHLLISAGPPHRM